MKTICKRLDSFRIRLPLLLLALAVCLTLPATVAAQKSKHISLKVVDKSVEQVIDILQSRYGISFVLNAEEVNLKRIISLDIKNRPLQDVMDEIFKGEDVSVEIRGNRVKVGKGERKENRRQASVVRNITLKGVVTDLHGQPVAGATVVEEGTQNVVVCNADGSFSIQPASGRMGGVLVISSVGMKSAEVPVTGTELGTITLEDEVQLLDEVVIVGYGSRQRTTLTGSVVTLRGNDLIKSPVLNLTQSLAGRLPGVIVNSRSGEPGADNPSVLIRGVGTLGDNSALYIIDGVERIGFGQLNPNDIESISVLKDAEAAIYGARAANGVIIVTTKRGRGGSPEVTFSFNQGFSQPTRNPRMVDSYTYATIANELAVINHQNPSLPVSYPYTKAQLDKFRSGSDPDYPNTDWYDFIVKKLTPQHRTHLSVSGSGAHTSYYLSLGELFQDGQYRNGSLNYKQYNFRSNIDVRVARNFKIGMNLAGKIEDRHAPITSTYELNSHIFLYWPTQKPYWPGTDKMQPLRDNENIMNWVTDNAGWQESKSKSFESTFFAEWDIPWVEGLSLYASASHDAYNIFRKTFQTPTTVWYKDPESGELSEGPSGRSIEKASLNDYMQKGESTYLLAKVNYKRSFGQHNIDIMAGYEQTVGSNNFLSAGRSDFPSTVLPELNAGSPDKEKQSNGGFANDGSRQNWFGRINYDYAGKYMLQASFRADGSSNFPKENRFGYFPGISAGWRISEENFMRNAAFLDELKLRASWGMMGNDIVGQFQYLMTYQYGSTYVIGGKDVLGLTEAVVPNPNITWESSDNINFGVEAAFWKGRLGIEVECFRSRRSDILITRFASVPSYTGLTLPAENLGKVLNRGVEVVVTHNNRVGKFRYSVSGNFNFARNKVLYMDEAPAAEPYQLQTGRPWGTGLYYNAIGIFRDQAHLDSYPHLILSEPGDIIFEDVNRDGVLDSKDMCRSDYSNIPEITFALNLSVSYANFDLSVLFQGQENAQQYFGSEGFVGAMDYTFGNFMEWRADGRWIPGADNSGAVMPKARTGYSNVNTQNSNTLWMVDAGFLRLKNIEIGYNLPSRACDKMRIRNVRFSLSGSNLFMVYDHMRKLGIDPESDAFWYYPIQRIFNLGISLTF